MTSTLIGPVRWLVLVYRSAVAGVVFGGALLREEMQ
jgi:hypothetical protein